MMKLVGSQPFKQEDLNASELALWLRFPEDFRRFYQLQNGGEIETEMPSWFKYDDIRRFPDGREYRGNETQIEELWQFISYENSDESDEINSILHQHYDRHLEEEFLPSDVYVFARCMQNSLLCISLRPDSYGEIYYWEWYWQYPWYKQFFDDRQKIAAAPFGDEIKNILSDEAHPQYQLAFDALNFATLIKVTDSFSSLLDQLAVEPEES
jgi:hypothetical protein